MTRAEWSVRSNSGAVSHQDSMIGTDILGRRAAPANGRSTDSLHETSAYASNEASDLRVGGIIHEWTGWTDLDLIF